MVCLLTLNEISCDLEKSTNNQMEDIYDYPHVSHFSVVVIYSVYLMYLEILLELTKKF